MQSSKAPKKTRKIADKPVVTAVSAPSVEAENAVQPRAARSSKKKMESGETQSVVKHHHKLTNPVVSEAVSETSSSAAKAFAAAAGAPSTLATSLSDASARALRHHDIAELAYSYWVGRSYTPGSPEEDWLRAEHELAGR